MKRLATFFRWQPDLVLSPIAKGTLAEFEAAMKAGGGMGDIKIVAPKEGETVKF